MKKANAIGLMQAVTSAFLFLFLVYQQAECIGLLHHEKTARLTTFGNQNTASKNHSTPQRKPISGKECRSNTDCSGIGNTRCMKYPEDTKMLCLCGDKTLPQNGACHHSRLGLHFMCNEDKECIRNAVCKAPTNSSNTSKKCECKEGYDEEEHECNNSLLTTVPCTPAVFLLLFYTILQLI